MKEYWNSLEKKHKIVVAVVAGVIVLGLLTAG